MVSSRDFDLSRKPKEVPKPAQPQEEQPRSVFKEEVLPRLGIAAALVGFAVMSGLSNVMNRHK